MANYRLGNGVFPDVPKTDRTIPVFKKSDPSLVTNFHPISILPVLSKTVMKNQLLEYFEQNDLLHGMGLGRDASPL